jgi:NAD(P)H-dependent flavin oxidoreductase YrpB (nitropropane dioxygenase family)
MPHDPLCTFPWTKRPLIANAPMSGIATSALATAVTQSGGLGLIGFLDDPRRLEGELHQAKSLLQIWTGNQLLGYGLSLSRHLNSPLVKIPSPSGSASSS